MAKTPLLICRTDRTPLMTHIAGKLRDMGVVDKACALLAYYEQWRNFLGSQQYIPIAKTYTLNDVFKAIPETSLDQSRLDALEARYGLTSLRNLLYTDSLLAPHAHSKHITRSYYSEEEKLKYLVACFEYFERMLDESGADFILDIAHVGTFRTVLDRIAAIRGIPYVYPFNSLLGDQGGDFYRINTRTLEAYQDVRQHYEHLLEHADKVKEGWEYLRRFRETDQKSIYHFFLEAATPGDILPRPRNVKKHWKAIKKEWRLRKQAKKSPEIRYNFQLHKGYWSTKQKRGLIKLVRGTYANHFVKMEPGPFQFPYVFMTLHMQPEATTSLFAPYSTDQATVVECLARAVPLGWKVVVKPNSIMRGVDTIHFFKRLSKIPNVVITRYDAPTKSLLQEAKAVFTISGTSGLEGALLGKPVFLMATHGVIWHVIRDVRIFTGWNDVHAEFVRLGDWKPDDASLAAYLQAVHDTSFHMSLDYIWQGHHDLKNQDYSSALDTVSRAIADKLETDKPATKG